MNYHGEVDIRKTLSGKKLLAYDAQLNPCFITTVAFSGAHYWVREFKRLGHQVVINAAKFIEPFIPSVK